jgi:hypothetical protein
MVESIQARAATTQPLTIDVAKPLGGPGMLAPNFLLGAQLLLREEIAFAGDEMLDRLRTETHLWSEFLSKLAEAHSVNGIRMMFELCAKHQLEFIRRDCERLLKHAERSVDVWSRLFSDRSTVRSLE